MRAAVVGVGLIFWMAFLGMTAYVIGEAGLTVLTGASLVILILTGIPLLSSLREPPSRR